MTSKRSSHLGGAVLLAMGVVLTDSTMAVAGWGQDDHGSGGSDDRVYVQSGDVTARSAAVWARCNREAPARLAVEVWEEDDEGKGTPAIRRGPQVSAETDYTGLVVLRQLRPDTDYAFRVGCVLEAEQGMRQVDRSPMGRFETAAAPRDADEVSFVWAADLAGQGWGRNPELGILTTDGETVTGGYVIFDVMAELEPDFAVFAGDMIYADNPIPPTKPIPDEVGGGIWGNDPTKDFVAITLEKLRENGKYNLGDEKRRRFLLETPIYAQWDDHEVTNNWYPGEILTAAPYDGLPADTLAAAARQALFEYNPIRGSEIYRKVQHGRHMELFLLDERAYRGPNPANYDPEGIEMLGEAQFEWLKQGLKHSKATWKVVIDGGMTRKMIYV